MREFMTAGPRTIALTLGCAFGAACATGAPAPMAAGLPTPPSPRVGSPAAPTPRQLAVAESMLHYCAQTDPRAAVALRLQLDRYAGRISRTTLERLRTTDEYRRSYASVESFTQIVDPRNATRVCAEAVQTMQEAPSHAP